MRRERSQGTGREVAAILPRVAPLRRGDQREDLFRDDEVRQRFLSRPPALHLTRSFWKTSTHGVVHPDVLIQFFPAQGEAVEAQLNMFQQVLRRAGEQRIFGGGKTYAAAIGQFQANPPGFHPAAAGDGFGCRFNDHAFEYKLPAVFGNARPPAVQCGRVRLWQIRGWPRAQRGAATTWPPFPRG